MVEYFFKNFFIVHFFELIAAIGGAFYLFRKREIKPIIRIFVIFLWFSMFYDLAGFYSTFAYFYNYEYLAFIKDTPIERNFWWYNIYHLISYSMYCLLFIYHLENEKKRKILKIIFLGYILTAIIYLFYSGDFFTSYSSYTMILGTFLLLICVGLYYFELLTSRKILNFYKEPIFYISVGSLIFYLVVTPLGIYSMHISSLNPEFLQVYVIVLKVANIFMYSCYTIGFLKGSEKQQSLSSAA